MRQVMTFEDHSSTPLRRQLVAARHRHRHVLLTGTWVVALGSAVALGGCGRTASESRTPESPEQAAQQPGIVRPAAPSGAHDPVAQNEPSPAVAPSPKSGAQEADEQNAVAPPPARVAERVPAAQAVAKAVPAATHVETVATSQRATTPQLPAKPSLVPTRSQPSVTPPSVAKPILPAAPPPEPEPVRLPSAPAAPVAPNPPSTSSTFAAPPVPSAPAAPPAPARPAPAPVLVPSTEHVHVEVPAGLQHWLDEDDRMRPWLGKAMAVVDACYAERRASNPTTGGTITFEVTMHKNARPSGRLVAADPSVSGIVMCATTRLYSIKMPLFTGDEGDRQTVRVRFQP